MDALADGLRALERRFGRVQFETVEIGCSNKEMYREEMGEHLQRRLFSFERLFSRDALPEIKANCHKIEPQFADVVGDFIFRTVNFDPGIMTTEQFITASHREYNHRIYLRDGVFAQVELIWSRGQFHRLPWTNPDYCEGEAIEFFQRVRASFQDIDEYEQLTSR
jgi:hypothetical protein